MRLYLLILFVLFTFNSNSQIGINTTSPSAASVMDIRSSIDGSSFGGFLPPRVTVAERDQIPVTVSDEGMLVYVINPPNNQLQIWDGTAWRTLFPQNIEFSAVLAGWDVSGLPGGLNNYGPSPFDATTNHPSVIVTGLTRNGALTTSGTGAAKAWGANGWYNIGPNMPQDAIDAGSFVTFTITPNFGVNMSLTTIETYNIRRSSTGASTGLWQYSIDGANFVDIGTPINWGVDTGASGNQQAAIDLSGFADLQNLTSTTTVTFRIVNWNASAAGGTWYINNMNGDDLIVKGNLN